MKVFLGADHRGFVQKAKLLEWLAARQIDHQDLGTTTPTTEDDYNTFAIAVAKAVLESPDHFGVLLCGSGIGMSIQANRFKGIRAALCHHPDTARSTREHNAANILCLAADQTTTDPTAILDAFLSTQPLNLDRYIRRNQILDEAT